jgi:hypothetical protein
LWFVKTLDTFDSFEISDLEKAHEFSAKDGVTMLQAPGTLSGMEFLRITSVRKLDCILKTLDTFDSFEITDLEKKVTNSAKDGVTMLQAPGTLSGMEFLRITA